MCLHEMCDRDHYALGYCGRHYQQFRKHGRTFDDPPKGGRPTHRCKVCGEHGSSYCSIHALEGFGQCEALGCERPPRSTRGRFCDEHAREDRRLRHFYGIGVIECENLRRSQGGKCAICYQTKPLHLDHCHDTGRIRGMLCGACNRGIGLLAHEPEVLRRAAAYLA